MQCHAMRRKLLSDIITMTKAVHTQKKKPIILFSFYKTRIIISPLHALIWQAHFSHTKIFIVFFSVFQTAKISLVRIFVFFSLGVFLLLHEFGMNIQKLLVGTQSHKFMFCSCIKSLHIFASNLFIVLTLSAVLQYFICMKHLGGKTSYIMVQVVETDFQNARVYIIAYKFIPKTMYPQCFFLFGILNIL